MDSRHLPHFFTIFGIAVRNFLIAIATVLMLAHNMVPHHDHFGEIEHHHDGITSLNSLSDDMDNDGILGHLLGSLPHYPSFDKVVHTSTAPAKETKAKISYNAVVCLSSLVFNVQENLIEHIPHEPPGSISAPLSSIALLRAPPVA